MRVRIESASGTRTTTSVTREWATALGTAARSAHVSLDAEGQMTDAMLADIASMSGLVALDLAGSAGVSDEGLRQLARFPHLRELVLDGTGVTDRGLGVLAELPRLERLSLSRTRVTDRCAAHLRRCEQLRDVNLSETETGDAAVRALSGKRRLAVFQCGRRLTDEGILALHDLPIFKEWHGGEARMELLSPDAGPNYLQLAGSLTASGLARLRGLDGVFALNIASLVQELGTADLEPLAHLPQLAWLAVNATDATMPRIAALPRLRFLLAQDTPAGDVGFAALARSQTLEYLWGRRCHRLSDGGFTALARLPRLRSLSVSCRNVSDRALSVLRAFPALTELMPIDLPDAAYRHVGACDNLESLVLMYCREATDAATEQIARLARLVRYFNSYTMITDRTPALLAEMDSLERITFDACHRLTDAGVAKLARLPRLKELRASGRLLTPAFRTKFPLHVRVTFHD
jgi:hypothetical protein